LREIIIFIFVVWLLFSIRTLWLPKLCDFFVDKPLKSDIKDLLIAFEKIKVTGELDATFEPSAIDLMQNKNNFSNKERFSVSKIYFEKALECNSNFESVKIENYQSYTDYFNKLVQLKELVSSPDWLFCESNSGITLSAIFLWAATALRAK
jgi:hypothetical protein